MTARSASCRCGQLTVTVTGDPVRMSVCHCLNCKKRSGSAFAAQARWPMDQATIEGQSKSFEKVGDSGGRATFHFCPNCGSDVYYLVDGELTGMVAIPLGAFDDPFFFKPDYSVYEGRKYDWLSINGEGIEHFD